MVGGATDQQSASQSRATQSLSVSLPADLSVDTAPNSLQPPLPSHNNFLITNYVLAPRPNGVEGAVVDGISAGVNLSRFCDELYFLVLKIIIKLKWSLIFGRWIW